MSQLTGKHVEPDPAEQAVLNEIGHLARAATRCEGSRPR
jgi:hypothetical protein